MKNYRAVIRDTLKSVQSDIPYDIKMAFPESKPAGKLIQDQKKQLDALQAEVDALKAKLQ